MSGSAGERTIGIRTIVPICLHLPQKLSMKDLSMKKIAMYLMLAVVVFWSQRATQAAIINFEDVAEASGAAPAYSTDITSGGFKFHALQNHHHLSHDYTAPGVANGTTIYTIDNNGGGPLTSSTMTQTGGGVFTLNSFWIAEHDRDLGDASQVTITGNLFGGGTITQIVNLDGIHDDTGGVNDFQFVSLQWTNLTSVVFQATAGTGDRGFSLDDITVNNAVPTPEPATLLMWGTAGLGLIAVRRRKLLQV